MEGITFIYFQSKVIGLLVLGGSLLLGFVVATILNMCIIML